MAEIVTRKFGTIKENAIKSVHLSLASSADVTE